MRFGEMLTGKKRSPVAAGRSRPAARWPALFVEQLESRLTPSSTWVAQGPGPIVNGQDEGISSPQGSNPVAGSIEAVAPLVTTPNYAGDANVIYVATTNGGVWKTTNATAATPTWTPLTDSGQFNNGGLPAGMSLNSIAISPLDANTIFVGAGRVSSYASDGGVLFGIARSSDGGATWTVTSTNVSGLNIRSIVPTQTLVNGSEVVLAGTSGGVYRSTDGGASYTLDTTGIPGSSVTDLVGDPGVSTRFYAAVNGSIYVSNDTGASWALDNGSGFPGTAGTRVLLSVHNDVSNDVVYAMVISSGGTLSNVYKSANQGSTWAALGVPSPAIFPGGQGSIHGAIVADATDPNTVYISGDRQNSPFPNANGANNFSGNVFRNVSGPWQNMVMNGANGTSPHADSRGMAFDQAGNILQVNDGGIYKLNNPNSTGRFWSSLNGNITPTEAHSAAYDSLAKVVFSGNQDTGTSVQNAPGGAVWNDILQGDGDTVAVDADQTVHAGQSIRYVGFTGLPAFRLFYNSANTFLSSQAINWSITSGSGTGLTINQFDPNIQFYTPYQVNRVSPSRILLGTANIYESFNRGDTVANLGFTGAFIGDGFGNSPISYGGLNADGTPNPGSFYVGAGATIYHRSSDAGSVVTLGAYPGGTIRGLVSDPQNVRHIFVLDTSNRVWSSFDEGATWSNLTANLGSLTSSVRTIQIFSPSASPINTVLIVGGLGGVWQMRRPGAAGAIWTAVGSGLPQTLVYDVRYDYTDNVLSAGTLGRGVWTLTSFFRGGGGTGMSPSVAGLLFGGDSGTGLVPGGLVPPGTANGLGLTSPQDPASVGSGVGPAASSLLPGWSGTTLTPSRQTIAPATGVVAGAPAAVPTGAPTNSPTASPSGYIVFAAPGRPRPSDGDPTFFGDIPGPDWPGPF
jgi:hypothetical protein